MSKYIEYRHHGMPVWVREDLKSKHREHCLCFDCEYFNEEDPSDSCLIANMLFSICVLHNLVTPVWECPEFKKREGNNAKVSQV